MGGRLPRSTRKVDRSQDGLEVEEDPRKECKDQATDLTLLTA